MTHPGTHLPACFQSPCQHLQAQHFSSKRVPPGMPFLQHAPPSKHMYESTPAGIHTGSILMNLGVQICSTHLLVRAAKHMPPDLAHMHALHSGLHAENT